MSTLRLPFGIDSDLVYRRKSPAPNTFNLWDGFDEPPCEGWRSGSGDRHGWGSDQSCGTRHQGCGFTFIETGNGYGDGRPVGEHYPNDEDEVFWYFEEGRWQYVYTHPPCGWGCRGCAP